MLERFLLFWLTLIGLLAYFWSTWFPGYWDPFAGTWAYRGYIFAVTMLAIGSLLPKDEIRQVARRWPTILGGTAVQYLSMPLLAYGCGRAFGFEGDWLIGVVMVGCVPGAMASNVLTLAARGNVSYSVSLTTSATLLSPVMVPIALWVTLSQEVRLSPTQVSISLCWMVVLPVIAGHLLSRSFAAWEKAAGRFASMVANATILWIIAAVIAITRDQLSQFTAHILTALLLINLGGYVAGAFGGRLLRLPGPMRRALTLEVGMQNAGIGTVLAADLFGDASVATIPPAVYTFGCMFTGTILAHLWAEWGRRETKIAKD